MMTFLDKKYFNLLAFSTHEAATFRPLTQEMGVLVKYV